MPDERNVDNLVRWIAIAMAVGVLVGIALVAVVRSADDPPTRPPAASWVSDPPSWRDCRGAEHAEPWSCWDPRRGCGP